MSKIIEGTLEAKGFRFGIIVSRFNSFISDRLLEGTIDTLTRHGADNKQLTVVKVPGAFELPLIAKKMANLLFNCSNKKLLIISGIPSKENNQDMAIDVQIKNITTAVVFALDNKTTEKSFLFISP